VIRRRDGLAALAALALAGACGSPAPPAPAPPVPRPVASTTPVQQIADATKAATAVLAPEPPRYDAQGRRDPFVAIETRETSGRSPVSTARLTGIVQGGGGTLALVETPDGLGYILKTGDTLGDGRLVEIGQNTAVFAVPAKPERPPTGLS